MSENKIYQVEEIMDMLPHRYPFLLVDRLEVEVPGEKGVGLKNVTMNEEFFQGHFPGNPVMPACCKLKQWLRPQVRWLSPAWKITRK